MLNFNRQVQCTYTATQVQNSTFETSATNMRTDEKWLLKILQFNMTHIVHIYYIVVT